MNSSPPPPPPVKRCHCGDFGWWGFVLHPQKRGSLERWYCTAHRADGSAWLKAERAGAWGEADPRPLTQPLPRAGEGPDGLDGPARRPAQRVLL